MTCEKSVILARVQELESRLQEADETLLAIRRGYVDAMVVENEAGDRRVFTLENGDRPYQMLIEQMQEGAFTVGQDGLILYGNRCLGGMLNTPCEQLIGQSMHSFLQPQDAATLADMLHKATLAVARDELTLRSADGRCVPINLSLSLLRRDGEALLLCGVITDLSAQKLLLREMEAANTRLLEEIAERAKMETAVRHLQKMEAVGKLVSGVAHDFNNILQSIVGGLEMVLDEAPPGTAGRQFADLALNAAKRGSSLTHHLLSYARKQVLLPQIVALKPFLGDLRTLLARTLGPHIMIDVRVEGAPSLRIDPGQLETALLNLAINASHAMQQGGTLSISVRNAAMGDPFVAIVVADTGTGMNEATLAQAVEPFFTTKGLDGTGLGLPMVQGFAAQSGGQFHIESAPGRGTKVTLCLPTGEPERRPWPNAPATPQCHGRILLVDDAPDVLLVAGAFLEKAGFAVIRAVRGDEALVLFDGGEHFDAVVSDYAMPGLNGAELVARARILQPDLPALIITGFANASFTDILSDRTMVLQKPFQRIELLDALRQIMA